MPGSNEGEEIVEQMKTWNPMKDAFQNSQFNQYCSGPGADLDPELQPSELAKQDQKRSLKNDGANSGSRGPVPYLLFKNVPKQMTANALYNICKNFGNVTKVRDSLKNPYYFADFASLADMEAAYRGLEHNSYGFTVLIGKEFNDQRKYGEINGLTKTTQAGPPAKENVIDWENRKYRVSSKQHPRPQIEHKPIVSSNDYNTSNLLQQNDPQRHFLIEDDAHGLEHSGLMNPNQDINLNSKYKYRTGRAYIEMAEDTKKIISDKSKESSGSFNSSNETYRKESKTIQSKCNPCSQCNRLCDSICARCSEYFCGIECQREAWPKHRYICGKPKHLRKHFQPNVEKEIKKNDTQIPETSSCTVDKSEDFTSGKKLILESKTNKQAEPEPLSTANNNNNNDNNNNSFSSITNSKSLMVPKFPLSGNLVSLTAISKTNVVFLRSKTYEDNLLFFKTNSAIQSDSKNLKPLRTLPKCGQIVVTRFNDLFSRAMILNTDDLNNIKLIHIDYGNLDVKLFDELYAAPPYYTDLPRLAIPVILKNVPDVYMTQQIRQFMYSYLDGVNLKLKYNEAEDFNENRGVHEVELIDESTNQNFNDVLISLIKPVEPISCNDIVLRGHLKHQLLPEGENIELVVMDNSLLCTGCISCTTKQYALEIRKFEIELQKYANSLPEQNYAPRIDELCIAKYGVDKKWYRGRCLDLVGDGNPTIIFFDYGNISIVNIKDIRRYPPQFSFPIFTSDCEIEGLPEECNENLVARLEQLIPNGSTLKCDSITVFEEERFHIIKVNKVVEALRQEGLLSS